MHARRGLDRLRGFFRPRIERRASGAHRPLARGFDGGRFDGRVRSGGARRRNGIARRGGLPRRRKRHRAIACGGHGSLRRRSARCEALLGCGGAGRKGAAGRSRHRLGRSCRGSACRAGSEWRMRRGGRRRCTAARADHGRLARTVRQRRRADSSCGQTGGRHLVRRFRHGEVSGCDCARGARHAARRCFRIRWASRFYRRIGHACHIGRLKRLKRLRQLRHAARPGDAGRFGDVACRGAGRFRRAACRRRTACGRAGLRPADGRGRRRRRSCAGGLRAAFVRRVAGFPRRGPCVPAVLPRRHRIDCMRARRLHVGAAVVAMRRGARQFGGTARFVSAVLASQADAERCVEPRARLPPADVEQPGQPDEKQHDHRERRADASEHVFEAARERMAECVRRRVAG
ncbi:ATP-dependent nuclease, subunit B / ATP-dependent nuclease, subunit A [Burkholderia singularis]|uniref:ATP-dependent nuclease, subunit B / ATP-dependent nuclease, subunit A n=1 Tax=Burkholderia singularis TaxID=1503053 RepID=A0A238HCM3_9BURK|nr:ATP-dependent nuclease, subunit B / ATP-dependent nuclease, subunit A [Burkholderia singularis]